jgi:hypothetical protein
MPKYKRVEGRIRVPMMSNMTMNFIEQQHMLK